MIGDRNKHKNKYRSKKVNYSYSSREDDRIIPTNIKLNILFGGVTQFIGIFFTIFGLGFLIPFALRGMPIEFIWIPAIFPIIGILLLFFSVRKRAKYLQIIKTGKFSYGRYVRYESTNVTINNSPVYRYFFDFKDEKGDVYTVSGETHTGRLSDEQQELLVYNPNNPEEAVLIDVLPVVVKKFMLKIIDQEKNKEVNSTF